MLVRNRVGQKKTFFWNSKKGGS